MKIRLGIILAVIVLLGMSAAFYRSIEPSSEAWAAANELKDSTKFGFGPRGVTAQISEDENRFFRVVESHKSHLVFRHLYDIGSPEAKAYAIVGLKQTLLGSYDSRINEFSNATIPIMMQGGCNVDHQSSKELITNWDQDSFRKYVEIFRKN